MSLATFHEYLTEAQQEFSVFNSIAENWSTPPIFFTPTVMKRLNFTLEGVIAYHGTSWAGFKNLVQKQGSKSSQLSVISGHNYSPLMSVMGGIETTGGVLVELKGDVSMSFNRDAYTGRVKGGRRTIQIESDWSENSSGFYDVYKNMYGDTIIDLGNDLIKNAIVPAMMEFEKPVEMARKETIEKVGPASPFLNTYDQYLQAIKEKRPKDMFKPNSHTMDMVQMIQFLKASPLPRNPISELDKQQVIADKYLRPAAGKFVRTYMDNMEKVLRNETYRQMFAEMGSIKETNLQYDEHIMSNFTVTGVWIDVSSLDPAIYGKNEDFKQKVIKNYGIKNIHLVDTEAFGVGVDFLKNISSKVKSDKSSLVNNLLARNK